MEYYDTSGLSEEERENLEIAVHVYLASIGKETNEIIDEIFPDPVEAIPISSKIEAIIKKALCDSQMRILGND